VGWTPIKTRANRYPALVSSQPDHAVRGGKQPHWRGIDGANIWVANNRSDNVTKLRASNGKTFGIFAIGIEPEYVAFDGANIWVTNILSNNVSRVEVCETTKMRYCGRPPDPTRARILTVPTELPEEEASKIRSAG
jgi:hypothetical protein